MLLSLHTHSDSSLRKLSFAKVIEKVFSSVLRSEEKRRRLRNDVSCRCYIIIDISLIDEIYESICNTSLSAEVVHTKIKNVDLLRGKNFPRTVSAEYFTSARGESRKNVSIDREQRLSNMTNKHLWPLSRKLSRFRVPTITCNYAKLRTLRALSTAFMPHEITFGSNEPETDWEPCGR